MADKGPEHRRTGNENQHHGTVKMGAEAFMLIDYCKFWDCEQKAVFYVTYGCLNQHVADSKTCSRHLADLKNLVKQQVFRCGQCPEPIAAGMYRRIHVKSQRISVHDLTGKIIKYVENPEYVKQVTDFLDQACNLNRELDKLDAAAVAAENAFTQRRPAGRGNGKRNTADKITGQDWADILKDLHWPPGKYT